MPAVRTMSLWDVALELTVDRKTSRIAG